MAAQTYPYLRHKTPGFMHNNISFNPFFTGRFAVASGTNFTLVGNGRVHIMSTDRDRPGGIGVERFFETRDCVYDVAWNEENENQVVASCGDGSMRMFDMTIEDTLPVLTWHEHVGEVVSVDWNNIDKALFVSGSWDGSIKLWNTYRTASLLTIRPHGDGPVHINQTIFSPHQPSMLATCSEDGTMKIIDIRRPRSVILSALINSVSDYSPNPQSSYRPPPIEVLSCDWNKYNPSVLATASADGKVRLIDVRGPDLSSLRPYDTEIGWHGLAAKKVAWSPHSQTLVASTGYDMCTRVWDTTYLSHSTRQSQSERSQTPYRNPDPNSDPTRNPTAVPRPHIETNSHHEVYAGSASERIANNPLAKAPLFQHTPHTEFIMGMAWSLFEPGYLVDASWDQEIHMMPVHHQNRPGQSVGQPQDA
ncbi:hypothetical protein I317_07924 [Kwoniella heveanensis CBS 569]|nr:hypothetical protein I317_07924 [Kwoniella heveanensis CBS 569]